MSRNVNPLALLLVLSGQVLAADSAVTSKQAKPESTEVR